MYNRSGKWLVSPDKGINYPYIKFRYYTPQEQLFQILLKSKLFQLYEKNEITSESNEVFKKLWEPGKLKIPALCINNQDLIFCLLVLYFCFSLLYVSLYAYVFKASVILMSSCPAGNSSFWSWIYNFILIFLDVFFQSFLINFLFIGVLFVFLTFLFCFEILILLPLLIGVLYEYGVLIRGLFLWRPLAFFFLLCDEVLCKFY